MDKESPKCSKWPAEGSCGCLVLSQVPGFISGGRSVRIYPAVRSRNVCSVHRHEAKSLMGYPLPLFGKATIPKNKCFI